MDGTGNYDSGDDYVVEFLGYRFSFNAHDFEERVTAAAVKLRAIVPNAGAYANESNYFDRTFQNSYWGPHYPRLAEVKKKYDPDGLFFVHHGVGSEDWSADGFTRVSPR